MIENSKVLTRRDFSKGTVGAALGASVLANAQTRSAEAAEAAKSATVYIIREEKVLGEENAVSAEALKRMVDDAVTAVTGKDNAKAAWQSLVKPTDVVGLVNTPHMNKTHGELVDAVRAALLDAGVPEANIVMAQSRDTDVVKKCTALVSLPALKAHWLTGIGTVLKNYIMFSGNAKAYHNEDSSKLGEIWNLDYVKGKTKLILVDALRPLCDKGPQPNPRYYWNYNGLITGNDPVAIERVCMEIISKKRKEMTEDVDLFSPPPLCIEAADKTYKLGTSDLAKIKIWKKGWTEGALV